MSINKKTGNSHGKDAVKENPMTCEEVMSELESLATEQTKKIYRAHGVHDPHFGVPTTAMRQIAKKIKRNQPLAEQLYATGNYDAMYFAGMIADPKVMTADGFERWMDAAYFYMLSDYVVAVSLAETDYAQEVADKWIHSGEELRMSAGWACYEWLLGSRPDSEFNLEKIKTMLAMVAETIHNQPTRTRYSMNGFVIAAGVSFLPLHEEAMKTAVKIGKVNVSSEKGECSVPVAEDAIRKAKDKGRLGFKRKSVRC
ncbi:MAG: DNA alkylation repair protein [Tannerella sp.]|jgi:3-methyladenine DNA glycosylase AlkD|nr:DNA alkylation repair protein [Tannerella sp.]